MRPLFMPAADGVEQYQELKRHFAVVDVERQHPFAVVTDDYELVTNKAAYDLCRVALNWALPQSVWRRGSILALNSSGPARPYMARLRVFRRLI